MKTHPGPGRPHSPKGGAQRHAKTATRATPLPPIDPRWAWHYRTLLQFRDRLARDTQAKFQEVAVPIEAHSMHPADSGTDESDHDLAFTLLAAEENALTEINDAITRILQGRYGICEATGVKIPARRLRALPWCRNTRDVEQRLERSAKLHTPRPPELVSSRPGNNVAHQA